MNTKWLCKNIELLKTVLNNLLKVKPPTDKQVVNCSQQLDKLIVQYQKILNNKKAA